MPVGLSSFLARKHSVGSDACLFWTRPKKQKGHPYFKATLARVAKPAAPSYMEW
jgi:hypothetical protein